LSDTLKTSIKDDLDTHKPTPVERKVSGKRKSFGSKFDDSYSPSKFSNSDDDAEWDEATRYSTPRKTGSRQSLKKQKTTATDSSRSRVSNKGSFDSPKESFVTSTKYAKRTSISPPRTSLPGTPKDNSQKSPKPAKQTPPPKEAIRMGMNLFPPPPSSPAFNFSGEKYARPSTPAAIKKQAASKRPISPSVATAILSKKPIQGRPVPASTHNKQDGNAIPPVPKLSEEILKKHRESANLKQKKLNMEDVQRHKKTISNAGSTHHPSQDVIRESIEKEGTAKSVKSQGTTKAKNDEKRKKNEFEWDDDVF